MKQLLLIFLLVVLVGCENSADKGSLPVEDALTKTSNNNSLEMEVSGKKVPKNVYDNIEQGNYFLSRRNYENAITKYNLANKLRPDIAQVHYNLGVAYYQTNKINLAINEWEAAIKFDNKYAEPYLNLGYAYERLSNNDKALENYYKFLQLAPDNFKASQVSKRINSLHKEFIGQGIIGMVTVSEKVRSSDFQPVEPKEIFFDTVPAIYVTAEIGDAPENTKIKAVWYYLGLQDEDILVNSSEKIISGPQNMVFEIARPVRKYWPAGRYEIRLYVDGKENLSVPFTILKGEVRKSAKRQNTQ